MSGFPQPLAGRAAPLMIDNVDTDTIIPSREMKTTGRTGLADGLFAPLRYTDADTRTENPDFVLNQPEYRHAQIIAAGANFGSGSSREHAVWALAEWGIRAVIAVGFAPIFHANCLRNGILPITLERSDVAALAGQQVTVDLAAQEIRSASKTHAFAIDPEARLMLAKGLDAIDLTLAQMPDIRAWAAADRQARPWIYPEHTA
ncbi:3-isopropylmalate dehydratase small subunit [Paraurantiacibacter namhicola]|uniref:3-isopropylmalate dehydratase small subunit n=1 Tax=Paraurantiacibacter namhicola TaxID=645517 RepID=A0A1C7D4Z1_9SPHN|nr:3-isopropylmalate dehydratase small subunit [Paraurantiacibacter namhicola]ANU06391.1 3-isopropylmalate dehydratase small subunit [Paraurantiacibacter namhicola]